MDESLMPLVTRGTINALEFSSKHVGDDKYLEGLVDEIWKENPLLLKYLNKHFSEKTEITMREVYDAAFLTYKLVRNQIEVDSLEVAYHDS